MEPYNPNDETATSKISSRNLCVPIAPRGGRERELGGEERRKTAKNIYNQWR